MQDSITQDEDGRRRQLSNTVSQCKQRILEALDQLLHASSSVCQSRQHPRRTYQLRQECRELETALRRCHSVEPRFMQEHHDGALEDTVRIIRQLQQVATLAFALAFTFTFAGFLSGRHG